MDSATTRSTHHAQALPPPSLLQRWARALHNIGERARTRRLLAQMDDRQLTDSGISHCERAQELQQPFWR
ncbi:DUF1127 domain-containing protein [Pseudomonas sp. NFXW11]|uniref:DUF1127 domain-containing protein n=1 Tax=Pseudomonas sp. NFXW11 TaxID=2819531 RepID=UPI003CF39DE9